MRKVWITNSGTWRRERIYLGGFEIWRKYILESGNWVLKDERETVHISDDHRRICMIETLTVDGGSAPGTITPRRRFQFDNHLGTACVETDETGAVISYEEYHPYGTSSYRSWKSGVEVSAKRYRYTGKERDEETSLYYHGARYYAPWLGRWMSADPAGTVDGSNLFAYVRGSPVVLSDPSGTKGDKPERAKSGMRDVQEFGDAIARHAKQRHEEQRAKDEAHAKAVVKEVGDAKRSELRTIAQGVHAKLSALGLDNPILKEARDKPLRRYDFPTKPNEAGTYDSATDTLNLDQKVWQRLKVLSSLSLQEIAASPELSRQVASAVNTFTHESTHRYLSRRGLLDLFTAEALTQDKGLTLTDKGLPDTGASVKATLHEDPTKRQGIGSISETQFHAASRRFVDEAVTGAVGLRTGQAFAAKLAELRGGPEAAKKFWKSRESAFKARTFGRVEGKLLGRAERMLFGVDSPLGSIASRWIKSVTPWNPRDPSRP